MIEPESLDPVGMVMAGGMTCGEWGQSSTFVVDEAGVEIRIDFTGLVEGGGCRFGVVSNVERTWLVVGVEASLVVNMMISCQHRVQEMEGDLREEGLLGSIMVGVDGMAGVERMVGTRVVLEFSL